MDINILKYMAFIKTVEYGSFTKAAEMLNYSQSGVSRMISDLEDDWKVTLLERGRGGCRLTSDGGKMLPYAKSLCDEYQKLRIQVDDLHGVKSGMIKIGTFSSVAAHWLPNIIKAFQKDYPGIDYELLLGDYGEIEAWLADGRIDCGFLRLPAKNPDLETIVLERDELLAILPLDHPLAKLDKVPVSSLCGEPFMLLEKGAKADVSEIFEHFGLMPRVHFTTWDDYAIMSMVEKGLGVSILPRLILNRVPYNIVAKELETPAYRTIALAIRDRKSASLAVKRFLDYVSYRR